LRTGGQLEKEFIDAGVDIYSNSDSCSGVIEKIKRVAFLCNVLRRERPDIIHYFLPEAYLVGAVCSVFSPGSIRIMSRRSLNVYQKQKPFLKHVEYFMHRFIHLALGNSKAVINELEQEGIEKKKIKLIYNGISVLEEINEELKNKARKNLGVSQTGLLITIVSNLIPYKGHKDLFYALETISSQIPEEWLLFCIGRDNGYSKELYDLAKQLNLDKHIRFVGHTRDTANYLNATDIGVLPSHQEGFSNSLLEGMSHGIPMVATDVGGNSEAIIDGVNGFIVPAHNPVLLGEKILMLVKNAELRNEFGKAAREAVKASFTIEHCVKQYVSTYDKLCDDIIGEN
jgi:glycosyltransferase involved in cell wall biosynthesis